MENNSKYEYKLIKGKSYRRNLKDKTNKSWRKICIHRDCMSISKGATGKCIKHQRNNICDYQNCKKRINSSNKFCDKHINNLDNKNKEFRRKNSLSNYLMNYHSIVEYSSKSKKKTLYQQITNNISSYKIPNSVVVITTETEFEIYKSWLKYTINDSTISEKCQGMCCSFYREKDKPNGKFCKIENKYLCNLCSVF
jgi:hypothetical protein